MRTATWVALLCAAGIAAAQAPERSQRQAQVSFEGGSGSMTSQQPGSAAGVALHFEDTVPALGRLTINSENLGDHGSYRSGEEYLKLQGPAFDGFHFALTGGDFRVSSNLLDSLFGNFFFPEIAARGFYVEASSGDTKYAIYAGSETLPLVPVNFFRARAPQSIFGLSVQRGLGHKLRLGARVSRLSSGEHEIDTSPFLFMLPLERRFRSVTSASSQATYKLSSHLRLYGEANLAAAERTGDSPQLPQQRPLATSEGVVWESPRLTFKADYVYQGLSYLPFSGYFLGDRRGPYAEVRYKVSKRLEVNGSSSRYTNNLERDSSRPLIESDSTSVVSTLNLPAKLTAGAQMIYMGTLAGFAGSPPSYLGSRLLIANLARSWKKHALRFSMRQLRVASGSQAATQVWPEVEDTFTSKRFTASGALRMQREALWLPPGPAFRGAVEVRFARITAHADLDSANLQGSTMLANNAVGTSSIRATAHLGKSWNIEIQSSRLRVTSLSNLLAAGAAEPLPQVAYEQATLLLRVQKQLKW